MSVLRKTRWRKEEEESMSMSVRLSARNGKNRGTVNNNNWTDL